jgi:serine/threonine protein phosphatase PrpC
VARRTARGLRGFGISDQGLVRDANEDRCHVDAARGLLIVVDGVGGHQAGGQAADVCMATLRQHLDRRTGPTAAEIRAAITGANNRIHALAAERAEWSGMACVVTVAAIHDGRAIVGHVGDTRLYKVHAGRVVKVTPDHSPVGEMEDARRLSEDEAMRHPQRNEVYRDVGSDRRDDSDTDFVDVIEVPFEADAAFLLCSDGLTDLVPLRSIADIVTLHGGDAEAVVRSLIQAANDAGGRDNVTAVYAEGPRFRPGPLTPVAGLLIDRAGDADDIVTSRLTTGPVPAPAGERGPVWLPVITGVLLMAMAAAYAAFDPLPSTDTSIAPAATAEVVAPGDSIMAALRGAQPGSTVIVEPGEYREAITLADGVRLLSRVPRGAILRLPVLAGEGEAAVTAVDVAGAEIAGFRIVGDSATPLDVGIRISLSAVAITDVEITGARIAAVDFGPQAAGSLVGCAIHDNPGAALALRPGAAPRISQCVFERNGHAGTAASAFVVMADATPVFAGNVFLGTHPHVFEPIGAGATLALPRHNWFLPERRGGRP